MLTDTRPSMLPDLRRERLLAAQRGLEIARRLSDLPPVAQQDALTEAARLLGVK